VIVFIIYTDFFVQKTTQSLHLCKIDIGSIVFKTVNLEYIVT